jgi:hypothetical protein
MKKIVCLVLAIMMLASVAMMASAAEVQEGRNWREGTEVVYTGKGEEKWTVTVPALLTPGGDAEDVEAYGQWPSNKEITVDADDTVTLKNSINPADTKDLAVSFAGIKLAGSNTAEVSTKVGISVAEISNALFGEWRGTINYTVTFDGVEVER